MMKRVSSILAASALVLAAACGGGGDDGPNWVDEVDAATAQGMGESAAYFAMDIADNLMTGAVSADIGFVKGTDTPNAAERLIARVRADAYRRSNNPGMASTPSPFRVAGVCEPTETGIDAEGYPIDSDGDGIPNDYQVTFPSGCTDTYEGYTVTYSGSLRIRDLAGLYGYRLDVGNFKIRYVETGGTDFEQIAINGSEQGTYTASGIAHSSDLTYVVSYQYEVAAGAAMMSSAPVSGSYSWIYKETSAYDPDGTITFDSPIPSGDLTFSFDYRILASGDEGNLAIRFTMATTDALHYDNASCYGVNDGTIVGDLNGNGDVGFTIDWTGCGTFTVTTRGTTEVATVAAR